MPSRFYYLKTGLVYIVITVLSSRQLSTYSKYIKVNMRLSYNIYLVFNAKYTCVITAPAVPTACLRVWYTKHALTRSVYQPLFTKH